MPIFIVTKATHLNIRHNIREYVLRQARPNKRNSVWASLFLMSRGIRF